MYLHGCFIRCLLPSDENSHARQHDQEHGGAQTSFGILGKDAEEDDQSAHKDTNDGGTTSTKDIGNVSYNDTTGHHTHGVEGGNQVSLDWVKCLAQKVGQPKEKNVIGQL